MENSSTTTEVETGSGQGMKKKARMAGKYTKKAGQCKYSGWSGAGISQFNSLRKMVEEDRACPEAKQMERELMCFCRTSAGKKNLGDNQQHDKLAGSTGPNDTLDAAEAIVPVA